MNNDTLETERRAEMENEIRKLKRTTSLLRVGFLVHGILLSFIILRIS